MSDSTTIEPVPTPAPEPGPAERSGGLWARLRRDRAEVRPAVYRSHHYLTIALFIGAVAVLGPQLFTSRSSQFLLNLWLVYSIAVIGFYWVFSLGGRFAFCQTFMMALGGYTSAWVTRQADGLPFILGVLAGVAAAALLAFLVGVAVRKAQHFYFAIATVAVTEVGLQVFLRAESFTGPNGTVSGISSPELFGKEFVRSGEVFWLFLGALGLILVLAAFLERSPVRREGIATGSNLMVALVSGVPAGRIQLAFFVMGSAVGGFAGALIGHSNGVLGTDSFNIDLAIGFFLMLLLGGAKSMWGPVLGAAFYVALPQWLSGIERYNTIVYGLLLLVVVIAVPDGLVGACKQAAAFLQRRLRGIRRTEEVADAVG